MTINTEPFALQDLFNHVIAGRADVDQIDALIGWLQEHRQRLEIKQVCSEWYVPSQLYGNKKRFRCKRDAKYIHIDNGLGYCGIHARKFTKNSLRPIGGE